MISKINLPNGGPKGRISTVSIIMSLRLQTHLGKTFQRLCKRALHLSRPLGMHATPRSTPTVDTLLRES